MSQPRAGPEHHGSSEGGREKGGRRREREEEKGGGKGEKREGEREGGTQSPFSSARMPYASDGLRDGLRHKSQRPVMGLPARGNETAVTIIQERLLLPSLSRTLWSVPHAVGHREAHP